MRSLLILSVLAPVLACSSGNGATGTDAGDLCTGAADPSSVRIPAESCAPACTPGEGPAGTGSTESTCYDGCNWCECTCGGPAFCTARACVDASMPDAGGDAGADSSTGDAAAGDAGSIDGAVGDSGADGSAPGEACSAASPCTGGAVCVGGPACGDSWSCVGAVACTDDVVALCGCDGRTFMSSSTCNTQPIAYRGSCEAGANCDRSAVTCRRVEPVCPDGQVGEVEGACWTGRCVGIDECACTTAAECPLPDRYTCHGTSGRCGPYL